MNTYSEIRASIRRYISKVENGELPAPSMAELPAALVVWVMAEDAVRSAAKGHAEPSGEPADDQRAAGGATGRGVQ